MVNLEHINFIGPKDAEVCFFGIEPAGKQEDKPILHGYENNDQHPDYKVWAKKKTSMWGISSQIIKEAFGDDNLVHGNKSISINLFPLPRKSTNDKWEKSIKDNYGSIKGYYDQCYLKRFPELNNFIYGLNHLKAVVCFGRSYWEHFINVLYLDSPEKDQLWGQIQSLKDEISEGKDQDSHHLKSYNHLFILELKIKHLHVFLTPFLGSQQGFNNSNIKWIGKKLGALLNQ